MPFMPTRTKKFIEEPVIEPEFEETDSTEETLTFKRSHFYSIITILAFAAGVLLSLIHI